MMKTYLLSLGLLSSCSTAALAAPPETWSSEEAKDCQTLIDREEKDFDKIRKELVARKKALDANLAKSVERQLGALKALKAIFTKDDLAHLRKLMTELKDEEQQLKATRFIEEKLKASTHAFDEVQCKKEGKPQSLMPGILLRTRLFVGDLASSSTIASNVRNALETQCEPEKPTAKSWQLVAEYDLPMVSRFSDVIYDGKTFKLVAATRDARIGTEFTTVSSIDLLDDNAKIEGETVETSLHHSYARSFDASGPQESLQYLENKKAEVIAKLDQHATYWSLKCGTYYMKKQKPADAKTATAKVESDSAASKSSSTAGAASEPKKKHKSKGIEAK